MVKLRDKIVVLKFKEKSSNNPGNFVAYFFVSNGYKITKNIFKLLYESPEVIGYNFNYILLFTMHKLCGYHEYQNEKSILLQRSLSIVFVILFYNLVEFHKYVAVN